MGPALWSRVDGSNEIGLRAQSACGLWPLPTRRGYPLTRRWPVPKYLIDRNFSKITEDELGEFAKNSKRIAIESFHDVVWHHSHVVIDPNGVVHTFCIYSAPSESRIREHGAAFGGHQIDSISEIAGDVDPDEIAV
jgi:uncharacterized protein DUF4242